MISAKLPLTALPRSGFIQLNKYPLFALAPNNFFKFQNQFTLPYRLQVRRLRLFGTFNQIEADPSPTAAAVDSEIAKEFRFFKAFSDGRIHFFDQTAPSVPPSDDPKTGVQIKDVSISPGVSARMFLPRLPPETHTNAKAKLPLLFYIHGGGFCMLSPFTAQYTNYVKRLVADANVIAVSVDYGLFPTRPIPACYEDSWTALQWVASHSHGDGPDPWLNDHADFKRVFIAGDSAGGNISHTLAAQVGSVRLLPMKVLGMILAHPYFGGTEDDRMWLYMCPNNQGLTDPRLKPTLQDLVMLGCDRVLVFVAEKDHLMDVGKAYVEELNKSGWKGTVELVVNKQRDHGFHLIDDKDEQAVAIQNRIISFIHQA